ncbi:uncharacterized protein F4822DRAFT_231041 [Hypoxylon trugodes]|uniref:uncharacterized protein n=1 Tax=Hypoxylon trugodes TaxID=326681 RepID=UPI002194B1A9|nr:uncharacterized protein F4822DRAFT_231041 [Hypoxylon trugodes]KAI1390263.1 hypothetical protein F4822DRAFT_231041 [Hypoxylon trugodes]
MDRVFCSCTGCDHLLGEFVNLWIKIGKSYISPVIDNDDNLNIAPTGVPRLGEENTLIDNCQLQDVACVNCRARVGLRCLDTPVNHVLHQGQLFLRYSSIKTTASDGSNIEITIQRTLKLREASHSGFTTAGADSATAGGAHMFMNGDGPSEIQSQILDHLQAQLDSQRDEVQQLNRAGYQMASSFDNAVLRIEGEAKKLRDSMAKLQDRLKDYQSKSVNVENSVSSLKTELSQVKKISQDRSVYVGLERELASAKQTIADVRQSLSGDLKKVTKEQQQKHETLASELNRAQRDMELMREELRGTKEIAKQNNTTTKSYTKEVASLRTELKELREQLAQERSRKQPNNTIFPTEEIEILTTSITKIGQRASQVETLQMELELLKGRIQRMEKAQTADQDVTEERIQHKNPAHSLTESSGRKRKRSPQSKDTPLATPSTKRSTRATWSSVSVKNQGHISMNSSSSITAQVSDDKLSDSPRLTKSGTIDKRALKKGLRQTVVQNSSSNG